MAGSQDESSNIDRRNFLRGVTLTGAAALTAPVTAEAVAAGVKPVSFARVPALGKPGTVTARSSLPSVGLDLMTLSNGVRLVLYPHEAETGRVIISARFGRGMKALPADRSTGCRRLAMAQARTPITR